MKPSLKDLRTTNRVLTMLEFPVSNDLKLYISSQIQEIEQRMKQRKINRMTEEELIAFDEKKHFRLRVHLEDGRFIQMKSNKATFEQAIREIDFDLAPHFDVKMGAKPLFHTDPTAKQRRVKNYIFVKPGLFVLQGQSANRMRDILERLDAFLELGWDIELL